MLLSLSSIHQYIKFSSSSDSGCVESIFSSAEERLDDPEFCIYLPRSSGNIITHVVFKRAHGGYSPSLVNVRPEHEDAAKAIAFSVLAGRIEQPDVQSV